MFNIKIEKITDSKTPNELSFLQSPFWGEFKSRHGWNYNRFFIKAQFDEDFIKENTDDEDCKNSNSNLDIKNFLFESEMSLLVRSFCKGLFSIAYIPLFPSLLFECSDETLIEDAFNSEETTFINQELVTPETQSIEFANFLSELAFKLKEYLPKNTIALRYDPNVDFDSIEAKDAFNYGLKMVSYADRLKLYKNKVDIQPPDTSIINLQLTQEEIMSNMHSKWRYNIRLSEKKGVIVKKYSKDSPQLAEKIDKFYELTKITNQRDGNASHDKSYYFDLINSSYNENQKEIGPVINLYIAEHQGLEIASIMTFFNKSEAIYLYGASSNEKRNLMPNHLLQWTAMLDAKNYGCKIYDLYGMPPEGEDENHPMHGLYMFKANFGGKIIHRSGSWDVKLKAVYTLYALAEKLRAFWYKKVIKKLKGR